MRFMMLMIPKAYQGDEGRAAGADFAPDVEMVEKMMKYNERLAKAGALISLDGFHPPVSSARISFSAGRPAVSEGVGPETREVIGGYWLINATSRAEAIEWARQVPAQDGDVIEVRQVFEMEEYPEDVQRVAKNSAVNAAIEPRNK